MSTVTLSGIISIVYMLCVAVALVSVVVFVKDQVAEGKYRSVLV